MKSKLKDKRRKGKKKRSTARVVPQSQIYYCEADVPDGLEELAHSEMRYVLGNRMRLSLPVEQLLGTGAIPFTYSGPLQALIQLQTVLTVYTVHYIDVARPTGLLGHHTFKALVHEMQTIQRMWPAGTFESFGISAAGSDSDVMLRLRDEFAEALGVTPLSHEMDLVMRLRRPRPKNGQTAAENDNTVSGWEAMLRLSPRPLSVRYWRVCDMEGALNAAVAHSMIKLTHPKPSDFFFNLMCGSGTLLVERLAYGDVRRVGGCDISAESRSCAEKNLAAAGIKPIVELHDWNATTLNLPDSTVDALVADLPFGFAVGSHVENVEVYPAVLAEAARVAKSGTRFVAITQEVRLMEQVVAESDAWELEEVLRIQLRGLHPRIFVMRRKSS
ncbi:MAG: methyltransferase domain-containing protein [Chloroflexota bacterium]